jgi:hypothetical protein
VWSNKKVNVLLADSSMLIFTRGTVLIALTNDASGGSLNRYIPSWTSPYQQGQVICSIFYPTQDCITVGAGGVVQIWLNNGESKIYDLRANVQAFRL